MTSRPHEAAIDEIVASCDGDVHGALKALLLVNEQLEAELQPWAGRLSAAPTPCTEPMRLRCRRSAACLASDQFAEGSFSGQAPMVERASLASASDV
jgi:hypothetical protein